MVGTHRYLFPLFAACLLFGSPQEAGAQTFINNDVTAESRTVSPPITLNGSINNPQTIACGQFDDDDGDGSAGPGDFLDCATLQEQGPSSSPEPAEALCILLNSAQSSASPNQFNEGYSLTNGINFILQFDINGTLRAGALDGTGFADLVGVIAAFSGGTPLPLFTVANGDFTTDNGIACSDPAPPAAPSTQAVWETGLAQQATVQGQGERGMELFDCDGDGNLDSVTGVAHAATSDFFIHVNMNDGSGLQDIVPLTGVIDTTLSIGSDEVRPSVVDTGDFDGDAIPDVVFVGDGRPGNDGVAICLGDGADPCGFTCTNQVDLLDFQQVPKASPDVIPTSVEAADFDGSGTPDLAVVLGDPDNVVVVLFNDGTGQFSSASSLVLNPSSGGVFPYAVRSGSFNLDDAADLAVTNFSDDPAVASTVAVFNSDGSGGFLPLETLSFPAPPAPGANYIEADAVETGDFDHCGGDDIVALAGSPLAAVPGLPIKFGNVTPTLIKQAHFWYNADEAPTVTAVTPLTGDVDEPIAVSATCADPTLDERSYVWTITGPSGSASSITPESGTLTGTAVDIAGTFQGDTPGAYTLTLACDSCDLSATGTVLITLNAGNALTQGGCLASLTPQAEARTKGTYLMLLLLPLGFLLKRLGKRAAAVAAAVLILAAGSSRADALTNSVSVNTFEPTVDDSEYFTVYSSPTMLQRNFHVGFYLDYAHHPYEFGNNNFNRVSGIVDSLITGNIAGSYAVLDWMTVGVLIPVYFWEHIDSATLGLDENNFALGDIQLVLKFRLLDREKHHVGISIVPFVAFPTSTDSSDFLGNGSFSGGGKLVIDGRIKDRVSLALNLGYLVRSQFFDLSGQDIDDQFLASLGISIDILRDKLMLIGEAQVATVTKDFFSDRRTTPAEARVGFRYTWANNQDVNVGAGFGLSNGIGSPDFRIFAGYTYTKRPVAEVVAPQPPVAEVQVGDELTLKDKIYFEFDKAVIRDISKPTLDKIAGFLKAHPEVTKIRIDGYTCDLGSVPYNLRLSQRRAKAAADYLIGQGIDPSRIGTVQGFGKADPLVPNTDEPNREQNRRVQIFVEAVSK